MRQRGRFAGFALAACALSANAATIIVTDNGDGAGMTLRQAIALASAGDTIDFAPALASPIALTQGALLIDKALTIQGPGAASLTISGQNAARVVEIAAPVIISDLSIADGSVTGANGGNGADGTGATGSPGIGTGGACVLIDAGATALLERVAVHHCAATGGNGGNGGAGFIGTVYPPPGTPGGIGGPGGTGGIAVGAGIECGGSLSLIDSSVVDAHATGGAGGLGGAGGFGVPIGPPGTPGTGGAALGGAVAVVTGGSLRIANSTIAESSATGGAGGSGPYLPASGGYATAGLLYVDAGVALADLEFSTLANGSVAGGLGQPTGIVVGNAINAGSTLDVLSSIVVGAQGDADLCYGSVTAPSGAANLSEPTSNTANPSSCNGFTAHATFAQTLRALDAAATPWPGYLPVWHGPAIDAAASCNDLAAQSVASDQHGTARPQGAACDVGAIEADYVFVAGFE